MDSLTHIVLGAIVGEALAGRRLGKKAMLLGALANSLPDIDFVATFWLDTADDLTTHRGITHSLLFVAVMAPLMAWAARRLYRTAGMGWGRWIFFFAFELFLHILLDAFNAYGTGWFEPFSHYRVSFNILFVADPFYSIWLGISFVILLFLRRGHRARGFWVGFGLILSSFYLYYCILNKYRVDKWAQRELAQKHIAWKRYFTTPTPLNNWLWYIVAEDSLGFHTAYLCIFDRKFPKSFEFFPRNDSLLAPLRGQKDVRELLRFSQGYYTVEKWKEAQRRDTLGLELPGKGPTEKDTLYTASSGKDTLVFNDLRFGQMRGWENGQSRFVFHYFLQRPGDNLIILQRGRFAGWDRHTLDIFIRRIRGN
jgi:inner membrane protein